MGVIDQRPVFAARKRLCDNRLLSTDRQISAQLDNAAIHTATHCESTGTIRRRFTSTRRPALPLSDSRRRASFYGTIRGVTVAGDTAGVFSYQGAGTNWTNPSNILGNSQGTGATYSAATSDPIFVPWGTSGFPDHGGSAGFPPADGNGGVTALDNVQVALYGSGTDATAANRQVEVCLSAYDSGASCITPFQVVTLPQSAPGSGTSAVFPSSGSFPDGGYWAGWAFNNGVAPFATTSRSVQVHTRRV